MGGGHRRTDALLKTAEMSKNIVKLPSMTALDLFRQPHGLIRSIFLLFSRIIHVRSLDQII